MASDRTGASADGQRCTDSMANYVYVSSLLAETHASFYRELARRLRECGIEPGLLSNTRDIWVRDFMPVQVRRDRFVQFTYRPDYLIKDARGRSTITDPSAVCRSLGIEALQSEIVLDGGNLVREGGRAVVTDKIFRDNPAVSDSYLVRQLADLLEASVTVIPQDPDDIFGHADSMVRFVDQDTVLVNRYRMESERELAAALREALRAAGLEVVEAPYNPYGNTDMIDATGVYLNFLRMKDLVVLPAFGLPEDAEALAAFQRLFPHSRVLSVEANEVAKQGGILNCVTWTMVKG